MDYGAWIACRQRAEQQLEREHRLLDRNSLGFTFYTPQGAALAKQGDQLLEQMRQSGCQR